MKKLLKDFFILISLSVLILFSTIYVVENESIYQSTQKKEVKKEKITPDTTQNFDLRKNVFSDKSKKMHIIIERPE